MTGATWLRMTEQWTNLSPQAREMITAESNIRYLGDGWLDIVDEKRQRAAPNLCPDLVLTRATASPQASLN